MLIVALLCCVLGGPQAIDSLPYAEQVFRLTNSERAREGKVALVMDSALNAAAQGHADDMAKREYFSHETLGGGTLVDRVTRQKYAYRRIAENIAMGQPTPKEVLKSWIKSPGHRANLLDAEVRDIGIGVATNQQARRIWVQVFGRKR